MTGVNTTGLSSGDNVLLGRGQLYFAPLINNLPGAYRDLGNVTDFQVTTGSETLDRKNFRQGLAVIDKKIVIEQSVGLSFTLDELTFDNLSLFFSGSTGTYSSPNNVDIDGETVTSSLVKGQWYEIRDAYGTPTFSRVYNLAGYDETGAGLANTDANHFKLQVGATPIPADDLELDLEMGLFRVLESSSVAEGATVDLFFQGAASAGVVDEVRGLTSSSVSGALKFVSINPANNNEQVEYQFHKVTLLADGEMSLIGDELAAIPITGQVEQNTTGAAAYGDTNGFVTITGDFA